MIALLKVALLLLCCCVVLLTSCSSNSSTPVNRESDALPSKQMPLPSLDEQLFKLVEDIIATELGDIENPNNPAAALALINQGANVNARNKFGETPLLTAARNGHIKVMQVLLDKGADINAQDEKGMTSLMWAAHMSDAKMTKLLLDRGANVDLKDKAGFTALSGSEMIGGSNEQQYLEVRRMLKKAGAK